MWVMKMCPLFLNHEPESALAFAAHSRKPLVFETVELTTWIGFAGARSREGDDEVNFCDGKTSWIAIIDAFGLD